VPSLITTRVTGLGQLQANLVAIHQRVGRRLGPALRAEAEIEMTESKRRVPVDTGALRASGHVEGPEGRTRQMLQFGGGRSSGRGSTRFAAGPAVGADVSVRLVYGGPAAGYAVAVHENVEAFHRVGEAKFLERPLNESAPFMAARIARRLQI